MLEYLPHVNAGLNGLAAILLVVGYVQIKQGREQAHKWTMLSCFGVSVVFLISYLAYHIGIGGGKTFPSDAGVVRTVYLVILASHALLAAAVPILAVVTIYLGLRDRRAAHRRLAVWTFPIWLYVSITGVIVYLMLYQLYGPQG